MSENIAQNIDQVSNFSSLLKDLSRQDFLSLGLKDVAYVKEIFVEADQAYVVHAADGSILSVMETLPSALAVVEDSNLSPVRLH